MDRIRKEFIRGTAHVRCLRDKAREAGVRSFGYLLIYQRDAAAAAAAAEEEQRGDTHTW